jgi:hypothetical protein
VRSLKKQQLIRKFEQLAVSNRPPPSDPRWVMNVSSKELSPDKKSVLSRGLGFATVHDERDKLNFIAAVEPVVNNLRNVSIDDKNLIRQRIVTSVNSAPKVNNLSLTENRALKSLKQDNSIVIVPADKGRATVVMDKEEYNDKIRSHLSDLETYVEVENNPTNTLQNKVNSELKLLKNMSLLSDEQYKYLRSSTASTPLFYALIKTHKPNNPIRPIVSFIDSPTYKLAKHLSQLLTPITNRGPTKLRNTTEAK